jgi:hypothetical protein
MINDMKSLEAEARRIGVVMDDETAASADALGDSWSRMSAALKQTSMALGQAVAPTLQSIIDKITLAAVAASKWIKENQQLVVGAAAAAAGLAGLGVVITGLGGAIVAASFGLAGLSSAFSLATGLAAAMLTPLGLLTAAVVGIGLSMTDAGGVASSAFGKIESAARSVLRTATDAGEGIRAALAGGDIPAAVAIAWSAIKLEYTQGVQAIEDAWANVKASFSEFFSWFRVTALEVFGAVADAVYTMFQHTGLEFVIGDQLEKAKEKARRFYADEIDSENQSMASERDRLAQRKQQRLDDVAVERAKLDGEIYARKKKAEQDAVYNALDAVLNPTDAKKPPGQEQLEEAEKDFVAEKKKQAQDQLERLDEQKASNQQDIENARRNIESIQAAFESTGSFGGAGLASFVGANSQTGIEQNTQVIADRMDKNNKLLRDIADNTANAYQFT